MAFNLDSLQGKHFWTLYLHGSAVFSLKRLKIEIDSSISYTTPISLFRGELRINSISLYFKVRPQVTLFVLSNFRMEFVLSGCSFHRNIL